MTVDIARLDVPLDDVHAEIAANRLRIRLNHLDELLAHPELAAMGRKATDAEAAEQRHLTDPALDYTVEMA